MIVLHEWLGNAELGKRALVVAFQKKAAVVAEHARFEEQKSGKAGGDFFHRQILHHSEDAFPQQLQQVGAVSVVAHRLRQRFQLRGGDVAGAIGDFLGAGDHQALPFLQSLNE